MYSFRLTSSKNILTFINQFLTYPDTTHLMQLSKVNRPMLIVAKNNLVVGCSVFSHKLKKLKIDLFIVNPSFRKLGIGRTMMQIIKNVYHDEILGLETLYTSVPSLKSYFEYQEFLINQGFEITTVKSNGAVIFTYAESIQKSNRED